MKKWANELNRALSKEKVQGPPPKKKEKKNIKKCPTALAIKDMQIQTMLRFPLTSARMAIIKNTKNNKCW
jgi:hypothetical protein